MGVVEIISLLVAISAIGVSIYQNRDAKMAQESENTKNRYFAQQENQKNRDFQAKQAELISDRQEELYWSTQSPSSMIRQYERAGVNPALMFGGSMPSPSFPSAPSTPGSSIGAPVSALPHQMDIMGKFLDSMKVGAEIKNINADTRNANSQALLNEIDSFTRGEMNVATIDFIVQRIATSRADELSKLQAVEQSKQAILNMQTDREKAFKEIAYLDSKILTEEWTQKEKEQLIKQSASYIKNLDATSEEKIALTANILLQNEKLEAEMQYWPEKAAHDASLIRKKAQSAGTEADILEIQKDVQRWLADYEKDSAVKPVFARFLRGWSGIVGGAFGGAVGSVANAIITKGK